MKSKNWFWGIIFILSAVFVVASQTEGSFLEIGLLSVIATVLLAALLISSLIRLEIFGVFFPLAFLYKISWGELILTALLLSIGFSILFRKKPRPGHHFRSVKWETGDKKYVEAGENLNGDNVYARVHFGSSCKYLHAENLQSGRFEVSFGSLEAYFDNVTLSGGSADVFVDCSFGSVSFFVPRGWKVHDSIRTMFGGVENVNRFGEAPEGAPTLNITGNLNFGGMEIKYI